jgi:hypothetical protein
MLPDLSDRSIATLISVSPYCERGAHSIRVREVVRFTAFPNGPVQRKGIRLIDE